MRKESTWYTRKYIYLTQKKAVKEEMRKNIYNI